MIFSGANCGVAIARNFPVGLRDGCGDGVRVQIAASLGVNQTNDITIAHEFEFSLGIVFRLISIRIEEPVIVRVLMVVARNLLLLRAFRVRLNVRVE